jgi:hypothetical protein
MSYAQNTEANVIHALVYRDKDYRKSRNGYDTAREHLHGVYEASLELATRGKHLHLTIFDSEAYKRWKGLRRDSKSLRSEWVMVSDLPRYVFAPSNDDEASIVHALLPEDEPHGDPLFL